MTPWSDANKVTGLPSLHIIDRVTWCQPITQQETNDKPKMSMQ
jgi:N-glycosylase/DNA lyase